MSGIETAFFGALAADAEQKVSKADRRYLRFRVRVGDGEQMTKGARVYVEGRLEISEWTGQDGAKRHGLSCMSWHTRLSQIGRQKSKRERERDNGTKKHSGIDSAA